MDPTVKKPGLHLLLLEGRLFFEFGTGLISTALKPKSEVGDGRSVIVIPGFGGSDLSSTVLRNYLNKIGYKAVGWGLGVNKGTSAKVRESLYQTVNSLFEQSGKPVSIIGWSLGGVFARELARKLPDQIHSVITMGTPFSGNPHGNRLFGLSLRVAGKQFTDKDADAFDQRVVSPPVTTVALHSKTDGIVSWRCSLENERENTFNESVFSSHFGYLFNPLVLRKLEVALSKPRIS